MNQRIPLTLFLCSVLIFQMAACSNGTTHKQAGQKLTPLVPGQVIPCVTCLNDSTLSYALYLPKNYDPSRRLPLIIAFDSHAAGKLPVDLFSHEAEKFGYIVAGSNNSKNGLAWETTSAQYQVMRRDILQRLSIDTSRIYTAGFSGGARVASSVAIFIGGISGVIGCSAGFPQIDKPLTTKFSYLGIVGNEDFNFTEMTALDKGLESAGFSHHLLVFNGKHAWPPADIVPSIFSWLELDAMRQRLKNPDQAFIKNFEERCQSQADSLHLKNEIVAEYQQCLKAKDFLKGVSDISSFSERIVRLSQTEQVKKQATEDDQIAEKETKLQQYYTTVISAQSETWWKDEVKRLSGSAGNNLPKADRTMYKRVLSYLSLWAYMKSSGAFKAGDWQNAGYFIRIYAIIDPTNAEAPYLEADWFATRGKDNEALKCLSKAVDLGFNDLKRIQNDPAFVNIKGISGYKQIINRIQNNK
jgi:hypothetical protein